MSGRDQSEFYRERAPLARPWSLVCLAVAGLLGLAARWCRLDPVFMVSAIYAGLISWVAVNLTHQTYRRGWRADADGLHQVFRSGLERHASWAIIQRLRSDASGCTIYFKYDQWRVGADVENWRDLVRRIEQETGLSGTARPDVDETVDPAHIAAWLGIQRDGALVCRPVRPLKLLWPAAVFGLCLLAMGAGWDLMDADSLLAPVVICFACAAPVSLWCYYRAGLGPRIRAHPLGLTVRTRLARHELSWADIFSVRQVPVRSQDRYYASVEEWQADWDYLVDTTVGEFRFHRSVTNSERLVTAMRRVTHLKAQGRLMPDADGLTGASISLAVGRGGAVTEERGLSRSDVSDTDGGTGA